MRRSVLLSAFVALTTPAYAQVTDAPRWIGEHSGVSLILPSGWTSDATNAPINADAIRGPSGKPGGDYATCKISGASSEPIVVQGHTLTQEDLNEGDGTLTVDKWLPVFHRVTNISAIEAQPVIMVDGRKAQLVTVTSDSPLRTYIQEADIISPSAFHQISCSYRTGALPSDEPPDFRQRITAEFLTLLRSVRWVNSVTP